MSDRTLVIKEGVRITGLQPEALRALDRSIDVFNDHGFDCVVTSARGDRHSGHSHHYKGLAFDLRSKHLPNKETKDQILDVLELVLGQDYQVFLEGEGLNWEHFHVEYDPLHIVEYTI